LSGTVTGVFTNVLGLLLFVEVVASVVVLVSVVSVLLSLQATITIAHAIQNIQLFFILVGLVFQTSLNDYK
jgi:hypothetical protein